MQKHLQHQQDVTSCLFQCCLCFASHSLSSQTAGSMISVFPPPRNTATTVDLESCTFQRTNSLAMVGEVFTMLKADQRWPARNAMFYSYEICTKYDLFVHNHSPSTPRTVGNSWELRINFTDDLQHIVFQQGTMEFVMPLADFDDACLCLCGIVGADNYKGVDHSRTCTLFFSWIKPLTIQAVGGSDFLRWFKCLLWLKSFVRSSGRPRPLNNSLEHSPVSFYQTLSG
eukprot:g33435.t1